MTKVAQNKFTEGLTLDTHPLVSMDSSLTNCLNGTLLTLDGNEQLLQNDSGNNEICDLNNKFKPIGVKEYNGIIYITSVDEKGNFQIGSYPSPEKNNKSSHEVTNNIEYPLIFTDKKEYTLKQYSKDGKDVNFTLHSGEDIKVDLNQFCINQGILDGKDVLSGHDSSFFNISAYLLQNNHLKEITNELLTKNIYTLKQSEFGNLRYIISLSPLEQVVIYDIHEVDNKIQLKLIIYSKIYQEFLYNLKLQLGEQLYEVHSKNNYNSDYINLEYLVDIDTDVSSYSLVKEYNGKNYTIYSGTENINRESVVNRFKVNKFSYKYNESTKIVTINYEIISTILDKNAQLDFNLRDKDGNIIASNDITFKVSPQIQIIKEEYSFSKKPLENNSFYLLIISDDLGKTVDIQYIITQQPQISLYYNNFRNDIVNPIFETGRITSSYWNVTKDMSVEEYDNEGNVYLNFKEWNDSYSVKIRKLLSRNGSNKIGFKLIESKGTDPYIDDIKFRNDNTNYKIISSNPSEIVLELDIKTLEIHHEPIYVTFFKEIFPPYDTNKITLKYDADDHLFHIEGKYIDNYGDLRSFDETLGHSLDELIDELNQTVFHIDDGLKNDSILMLNIEIDGASFQFIRDKKYEKLTTLFLYRFESDFYILQNMSITSNIISDQSYYYKYYTINKDKGNVLDVILDYQYDDAIVDGTIKFNDTQLINNPELINKLNTQIDKYTPSNKAYKDNIYDLCDRINKYDLKHTQNFDWKKDGEYFYYIKYDKYIKLSNTTQKPVRAACIFNSDSSVIDANTLDDVSFSEEDLKNYKHIGNFYTEHRENKKLQLIFESGTSSSTKDLLTVIGIDER